MLPLNFLIKNMKKRKNKNDIDDDNGFAEWGGYMEAKKQKLLQQFNTETRKNTVKETDIFKNIAIFVNGYTSPTSEELKVLMAVHGGAFHHYQSSSTTHIIALNLPDSKVREISKSIPVVKPDWITESIRVGKLLDYKNFLLYTNQNRKQPCLPFNVIPKTPLKDETVNESPIKSKYSLIGILEENSPKKQVKLQHDLNRLSANEDTFQHKRTKTAVDPSFLSEFYQNSRLHLISTLGAEFKRLVGDLRDNWCGKFPGRSKLTIKFPERYQNVLQTPIIMHIDMDCFFVSVGLRSRPHLQGKPVAVTHAKGHKTETVSTTFSCPPSMSEIASCNYEARKYGIKNGMFLGSALKLCPSLQTIPYDFKDYREVSYILYNTISEYTLDIEAVSCDEMYVDVGPLLEEVGISVDQWASHIRSEIWEATGCPCSTGFGSNRLQARLATRRAKPDGYFHLTPEKVEEFLAEVPLGDLPGVGRATITKLDNLGLKKCSDVLQSCTVEQLRAELGAKIGTQVHEQVRGIDLKPLNFKQERKSVSADVNYGIRFEKYEQVVDFVRRLSDEVFGRLVETGVSAARCVTLKVLVRAPDAPKETVKFLGCGVCNSINKSTTKGNLISDSSGVFKVAKQLLDQIKVDPEDFRGIGIQLTRLEKNNKVNKLIDTFLKSKDQNNDKTTSEIEVKKVTKKIDNKKKSPAHGRTLKNYFNQSRSKNSAKIQKLERSELDVNVLKELPEFVQEEILQEYKITLKELEKLQSYCKISKRNEKDLDLPTKKKHSFEDLSWNELKDLIESWIRSGAEPLHCDIVKFGEYLKNLALERKLDVLEILVKFLHRNIKEFGDKKWHNAYFDMINLLQEGMLEVYSNKLFVPNTF